MYINTDMKNNSLWVSLQSDKSNNKNPMLKAAKKNAAVQILKQKQFSKDQLASLQLVKDKQLASLEKRKKEMIDNIKDVCDKNKNILSKFMGISADLDNILTGNADYVLNNMDSLSVGQAITGAQMSAVMGNTNLLKQYYSSDMSMTFKEFAEKHANDDALERLKSIMDAGGNIQIEKIRDADIKGTVELLEVIKKEYQQLFSLNDKIKQFKEDTIKQIEEFSKSLEKADKKIADSYQENDILGGHKKKKTDIDELV